MQSLTAKAQQLDRHIKGIIRAIDLEKLSQAEKKTLEKIRLACNEVKLDVRDYEYAETRAAQEKWAKISRHNLAALEHLLLTLSTVFGPVDIAEFGATIDTLKKEMT